MQRIKIQRQGDKVTFNPADQMVDRVTDGGSFIFENQDAQESHQPQPDNTTNTWLDNPILPGEPSTLITANKTGSYSYHCKLHPAETGVVVAPNVITIQMEMIRTGFNPATQKLNPTTDSGLFVFLNLDQSLSHQPVPDDASQGTWFANPIVPGAYSAIKGLTAPGTYNYHCALHPDDPKEKGALTVPQPQPTT